MHYPEKFRPLQLLLLAALAVGASFLWQGHKGFNLWDEGFLWYGAQRVMLGEVPIRDFMAYDPGRYYWAAALMSLWGDNGIMSLRAAVAIFQVFGLFVGLLLIGSGLGKTSKSTVVFLLLSVVALLTWMLPRHKLFDISISIFLVGILTHLIQKPTAGRYFLSGAVVGLIAVFGRNHGVYGAAGCIAAMLWLALNRAHNVPLLKGAAYWAAGVAIGFSPVLLMALLVPGFAAAFIESVLFLFELGSTNIPLPVPWPWKATFAGKPLADGLREVLFGLFFLWPVIFGVLAISWVVRSRIQGKPVAPVLAAAAFLSLPYAHFAYSRADLGHLAQGIYPTLLGSFLLLLTMPARVKWPVAGLIAAASLWVTAGAHPGWQCRGGVCKSVEISGNDMLVLPHVKNEVDLLRQLTSQYAPDGRAVLLYPFWPGSYALLERRSPVWEIFALSKRSKEHELAEIERIKQADPGFVLVWDMALDGVESRRFPNTHPLTTQFIETHFVPVKHSAHWAYKIYKARE